MGLGIDIDIERAESEASPLPVYCTSTEGFTLAHQTVGYLTSDYTRSTDIGTKRCPWKIVAQVRIHAETVAETVAVELQPIGRSDTACSNHRYHERLLIYTSGTGFKF